MSEFASYGVWVSGTEDATPFGVERSEGRLRLTATKADVTDLVERPLASTKTRRVHLAGYASLKLYRVMSCFLP